jgi:hypoxanthine phosphoribosyltransferase
MRRLRWRFAERASRRIANEMIANGFSPTLIIGIGRGGAVMGALISGCLGHRPLVVIDRKYTWKKGDRFDDMIFHADIPHDFLERVLVISGEVHSGNTMKLYYEHFNKMGAKSLQRATLFYEKGATIDVEYKGIESTRKNIVMPWMFARQYVRADRHPPKDSLFMEEELGKTRGNEGKQS